MVGLSTMILALRKRRSTHTCFQHIGTRMSMFLSQACCLQAYVVAQHQGPLSTHCIQLWGAPPASEVRVSTCSRGEAA